jgi:hypothetical protein
MNPPSVIRDHAVAQASLDEPTAESMPAQSEVKPKHTKQRDASVEVTIRRIEVGWLACLHC